MVAWAGRCSYCQASITVEAEIAPEATLEFVVGCPNCGGGEVHVVRVASEPMTVSRRRDGFVFVDEWRNEWLLRPTGDPSGVPFVIELLRHG